MNRNRGGRRRYKRWSDADNARLDDLVGKQPAALVAVELGRDPDAVKAQARRRGHPFQPETLSITEVARLFGTSHTTVTRCWIRTGLIRTTVWPSNRGNGPERRATDEAILAFIRDCPWAYDPERMLRGRFQEAAMLAQGTGWLTVPETAGEAFCSASTVRKYMQAGQLVSHLRLGIGRVVARSDVPRLRELLGQNAPAVVALRRLYGSAAA